MIMMLPVQWVEGGKLKQPTRTGELKALCGSGLMQLPGSLGSIFACRIGQNFKARGWLDELSKLDNMPAGAWLSRAAGAY